MKVRLEINQITIDRPKKRWKIYFVIAAEHPTDETKMVVTTFPIDPIKIVPNQNNEVQFDSDEPGSEGLLVLRRDMPINKELNVHCYVRHSRSAVRITGAVLKDIQNELGSEVVGTISEILGTTNPWLQISKAALPLLGKILTQVPDRDMGFVSMFERFGDEFMQDGEIDRQKTGGYCNIVYSWSIDQK
jgi:hypothetical protein